VTREEAIKQLDGAEMMLLNRDFKPFNQAILMAIAALREQDNCCKNGNSSWISVEDRLPEDRYWVLVWHTGFNTAKKAKYKDNGFPIFVLDGYGADYGEVTHWMPLPEPPEVEG
jgi:hypothetical protein